MRRWTLRVVLGLALSAFSTFLCLRYGQAHDRRFDSLKIVLWEADRNLSRWPGPVPKSWPRPDATVSMPMGMGGFTTWRFPGHTQHAVFGSEWHTYSIDSWGFPLPCIRQETLIGHPTEHGGPRNPKAIRISPMPRGGLGIGPTEKYQTARTLIIPNLIANALFWIGVVALLHRPLWATFESLVFNYVPVQELWNLRVYRRLQRGECPKCRYPLTDAPICSECGASIPPGWKQSP